MPGNNPKKPEDREQSEEELERLAYNTMKSLGWLIPRTPEDVAKAEEALAEEVDELPESLRDPYAILDAPPQDRAESPCSIAKGDAAELLARVAREGKAIPPEVEERMRRDREQAERKDDHDRQP